MKLNYKLIGILNAELNWNKQRMKCFVGHTLQASGDMKMKEPSSLKKHGRKEASFFRYRLNLIHEAIAKLVETVRPIKKLIMLLKPSEIPLSCFKGRHLVVGAIF